MNNSEMHGPLLLQNLLDTASDAIITIDQAHNILMFNLQAEQLFGYPASEVIGQPLSCLLPERFRALHGDHVNRFEKEVVTRRLMGTREELAALRKDGSEFPVEISISKATTSGGETLFSAIVRDVTERKVAERVLQVAHEQLEERVAQRTAELEAATTHLMQSSKLEAIGELAANIAHEMNNPLGIISAKARLLLFKEKKTISKKVETELIKIIEQTDRLSRLTRGLLDYSRPSFGQKTKVDITHPLRKVLDIVGHRCETMFVDVEKSFSKERLLVYANSHELEQVFLNFFLNAVDAMPDGGILKVTAHAPGPENIEVIVEDNGEGMTPDVLAKIFEPFFSTKEEGRGTGLGLSVCFGLIRSHDGSIAVESKLGEGAKFILTLPRFVEE